MTGGGSENARLSVILQPLCIRWGSGALRTFAGSLDGVLDLFLESFPVVSCSHSMPQCGGGGQRELARTAHWSAILNGDTSDLVHTCPFSRSRSTLCKHDLAAHAQPWALEEPGRCQESPTRNESAPVVGIGVSPTPPHPGLALLFSISLSQPAFQLLWEMWSPAASTGCAVSS